MEQEYEFPRKPDPTKRPTRRAYILISAFAVLLVLFPFLFWHGTWFGRELSDTQIDDQLNNMAAKPREAQHALVQIGERIGRGEMEARRWYPKIIEAAANPSVELRQTAAWIMGQDHTHQPFHPALVRMLGDSSAMVRRNAALSLSNFGDAAALPELRAMLRSSEIPAPAAGVIKFRLKEGEYVNPGTLVARVGDVEARAPLPGEVRAMRVRDGAQVNAGDPIADVSADKEHVWEALRALVRLGSAEDIEAVQRYLRGAPGMPGKVQQQAGLTLQAIQNRAR